MVGLVRISGLVGFVSVKLNVVCCSYSHLRPHPMRDVVFLNFRGFCSCKAMHDPSRMDCWRKEVRNTNISWFVYVIESLHTPLPLTSMLGVASFGKRRLSETPKCRNANSRGFFLNIECLGVGGTRGRCHLFHIDRTMWILSIELVANLFPSTV